MRFTQVTIEFTTKNLFIAEELICNIFFSFKLKGVICDIPLDEPDEGFGTNTIAKPAINSITGFLPLIDSSEVIIEKIKEKASKLEKHDISTNVKTQIVDEKDWSESWKAYFEVTKVTDKIIIKPLWKEYVAHKDQIVIHLDPGMAFGTGTHPSTFMCIKIIEKYLEVGAQFLDVGTGSGILMVTAAKLGAKSVTGIDNDEVAIKIAKQNLDKNSISSNLFELSCTTLEKINQKQYDLIAVNIIAQVIVEILPEISKRMTNSTITILSGIIKERLDQVLVTLKSLNIDVIYEENIDEWVALAVKKR